MIVAAIETTQAIVIGAAFAVITVIGLLAGRWRKADLSNLDEWALGGRQFGGVLTWFLQGGSVYTTYSFIAVPALVFGAGAIGFFALPYLIIAYIVAFLIVPKLWTISRARGYVTPADFVRERFASRPLAAAITLTGIVATMPYIALQVYGIEICMAQIGLPVQASLWLAFALLAVITYVSGLRSATLIAIVKDVIARGVAGRPRILRFDEATSALDNRTQAEVADAIAALKSTRVVIAHRLSTVQRCDRVLVMEQGRVVQEGTFDALLEADGPFRRLAHRQLV